HATARATADRTEYRGPRDRLVGFGLRGPARPAAQRPLAVEQRLSVEPEHPIEPAGHAGPAAAHRHGWHPQLLLPLSTRPAGTIQRVGGLPDRWQLAPPRSLDLRPRHQDFLQDTHRYRGCPARRGIRQLLRHLAPG